MPEQTQKQIRAECAAIKLARGGPYYRFNDVPFEELSKEALRALCARMAEECGRVAATRTALKNLGIKRLPPRFAL